MTVIARCHCGQVEIVATGAPIASAVCYCADCQAGSAQIAAMTGAGPVSQPDGGTAYALFRKDRLTVPSGETLLKSFKLTDATITNRVVATCCNAAMMIRFDKGPHWITVFRDRLDGDVPPIEMRICTRSKPAGVELGDDLPNYGSVVPGLVLRLLTSRLAMLVGL